MPLKSYETDDPFDNHPLFKTEEQARLEETMDGTEPAVVMAGEANPWPGEDTLGPIDEPPAVEEPPLGPLARLRLGRLRRGEPLVPPLTPSLRYGLEGPAFAEPPQVASPSAFVSRARHVGRGDAGQQPERV